MQEPYKKLKYLFCLEFIFLLFFAVGASADFGYIPLAPFPTLPSAPEISLAIYLKALYTAAIGIAIVLAVVEIVLGGVQYITSTLPGGKTDGKSKILGASLGLLLVVSSWIILNTLNPGLLTAGINLPWVDTSVLEHDAEDPNETPPPPPPAGGGGGGGGTGTPQSDAVNRARLTAAGVTFNPVIRGRVVSVEGMRDTTVDTIIAIKEGCACNVSIASGTDGKHSTKGTYSHVNGYKVDLQANGPLDSYIKSIAYDTKHNRSDDHARVWRDNNRPGNISYNRERTLWDLVVIP